MGVEMDGTKWVLVDTPLPPAVPWTNDIIDKVRESIRPYQDQATGGINWKLIIGGVALGVVGIMLLRRKG